MDDASPPAPSPVLIEKLLDHITPDWPRIQGAWEVFRARYGFHLRADTGEVDSRAFLTEAVGGALAKGRLRQLASALDERGLLKEGFDALAAPFYGQGFQLQTYLNPAWPSQFAHSAFRAASQACSHVCTISIDGQHRGTGVLVTPTLVATAAHVIEPLVKDGAPIAGSLERLALTFTDPDAEDAASKSVAARLRTRWIKAYSARGATEGAGAAIDCIDGLQVEGPWDLALIHLMSTPRPGLSGAALYQHPTPPPEFGIHILHHPASAGSGAMQLLWSIGQAKQALGAPALRLLHNANTDGGSSGAPCFDNNWRVVALHQGGSQDLTAADQLNRAVPVHCWLPQLETASAAQDEAAYLREVSDVDDQVRPVLGRRDIQRRLRASMTQADSDQVLVVRGPSGAGKSFTRLLLKSLALANNQRLVVFEMQNVQADDAEEFASRILGGFGAQLPPAAPSGGLTSLTRELRNGLVPTLLAELDRVAAGTPLWLFLDGFEQANLPLSGPVMQLVEGLIGMAQTAPNLRLVLSGWHGALHVGPGQTAFVEDLSPRPSPQDIADYLWLSLAPPDMPLSPQLASILENTVSAMEAPSDYPAAVNAAQTILTSITPIVKLVLAQEPTS